MAIYGDPSLPGEFFWMSSDPISSEFMENFCTLLQSEMKPTLYRATFHANYEDPRPLEVHPKYPYWITGYAGDGSFSTMVAYVPSDEFLYENWPEATNVELTTVDSITFTDRFSRPEWYEEGEE